MCCLLVSGFLTEITQQIHSLRASGVMSSHFARATGSEMRTFRKSAGTLCTAPGESAFLFTDFILRCRPHRNHEVCDRAIRNEALPPIVPPAWLCQNTERCGAFSSFIRSFARFGQPTSSAARF